MSDEERPPLKKLLYKCPQCGEEWHKWVPVEEKKLRRFCPNQIHQPKLLVGPYKTEQKLTRERKVTAREIKPYW